MDGRVVPDYEKAALWLADLYEELDLIRYPSRLQMMHTVDEAMRRADSLARLEHELQQPS